MPGALRALDQMVPPSTTDELSGGAVVDAVRGHLRQEVYLQPLDSEMESRAAACGSPATVGHRAHAWRGSGGEYWAIMRTCPAGAAVMKEAGKNGTVRGVLSRGGERELLLEGVELVHAGGGGDQ